MTSYKLNNIKVSCLLDTLPRSNHLFTSVVYSRAGELFLLEEINVF